MPRQDSNSHTFTTSEAIPQHRLVKRDAGAKTISLCGLGETPIGVSEDQPAFASGENIGIRLFSAGGVVEVVVDAAAAIDGVAYAQASGKADDDSSGGAVRFGQFIEAAIADGDRVEVLLD